MSYLTGVLHGFILTTLSWVIGYVLLIINGMGG